MVVLTFFDCNYTYVHKKHSVLFIITNPLQNVLIGGKIEIEKFDQLGKYLNYRTLTLEALYETIEDLINLINVNINIKMLIDINI